MLTDKEASFNALRSLISERLIPAWAREGKIRFVLPGKTAIRGGSSRRSGREAVEVHPFVEICICLAGQAEIWLSQQATTVNAGEILLIPPGVQHSSAALHCIMIRPEKAYSKLMWVSILPCGAVIGLCESALGAHRGTKRRLFFERNVSPSILRLLQEFDRDDDLAPLMAKGHLIEAFAWICRGQDMPFDAESVDSIRLPESPPSTEDSAVGRAKHFLHQEYHTRLDLNTVARAAFMHKPRLCREFKKSTGLTISEYLTQLRVESSKRLLQTGLRISVIAELVGFDDPYYFSRVFKKITGISPKEYQSHGPF
jgi:AraC-like DNA-binding protein